MYYVSNPAKGGGLHNYGMAVDLTIVDASGKLLPMGTPYDFFGTEAHTDKEEALVQTGNWWKYLFSSGKPAVSRLSLGSLTF